MKIFVNQFYTEHGSSYSLNHIFQRYLSKELSNLTRASRCFISRYGSNYEILFRMNAKRSIANTEICGPEVYPKDKDVEYSIFIPYEVAGPDDASGRENALRLFIAAIVQILQDYKISTADIERDAEDIISTIMHDPAMIGFEYYPSFTKEDLLNTD